MITIPISFALCFAGGLALYGALTSRNATIATYLIFYLTLPSVSFNLPGVPDLSKSSVIALTCWLGTILFASDRLLSFRPRWFDLAALFYMCSPFPAALSNDLTLYDGLSGILTNFLHHGVSPYLLGRIHFRNANDIRALAIAIFIGGLAYVLPCLFEIRMSPISRSTVYGLRTGANIYRMGGYRPVVFLSDGLELGMWMTATCAIGYTLWLSRSVKQIRGIPMSWLLAVLLAVTVLCKSTGAIILLVVGIAAIYLTRRIPTKAWFLTLVLVPPVFEAVRITDLIPINVFSRLISENISADRAESFQYRADNEDMYINKTKSRILFGWGGYGMNQIYDSNMKKISVNDSKWIIVFSTTGLCGLLCWNAFSLMPLYTVAIKSPARGWLLPETAPALAIALAIALFNLDNLANDMDNPIYSLGAGAVVSAMVAFRAATQIGAGSYAIVEQSGLSLSSSSPPSPRTEVEYRLQLGWLEARLDGATTDPTKWADLAHGHESFARYLAAHGRTTDAEEVWNRAIHLWDDLAAQFLSDPVILHHAAAARNDLAWMLSSRPETTFEETSRAITWAQDAIRINPESIVFRNTLAMAFHQEGSWASVLQVLGDSQDSTEAPVLVCHNNLLRALAHHHLGNVELTRVWRNRAQTMIDKCAESPELRRLADKANRLLVNIETSQTALPSPTPSSDSDISAAIGQITPID